MKGDLHPPFQDTILGIPPTSPPPPDTPLVLPMSDESVFRTYTGPSRLVGRRDSLPDPYPVRLPTRSGPKRPTHLVGPGGPLRVSYHSVDKPT